MTMSEHIPRGVHGRELLSLTNLLMRNEPHRITTVTIGEDSRDPPLYVTTSIQWRQDERGTYSQLPRLLSYLEVMRGTKGVPMKIPLNKGESMTLYIPTGKYTSDIPMDRKEALHYLRDLIRKATSFTHETAKEVENIFWDIARKRGFSPDIVDRIEKGSEGFSSSANLSRFMGLVERYFSIKFRIHSAESVLHVEE